MRCAVCVLLLALVGCNAPETESRLAATDGEEILIPTDEDGTAEPDPTPIPSPGSRKPLLSVWSKGVTLTLPTQAFSVDMSVLHDEDAGAGITVTDGLVYVNFSGRLCPAKFWISGTEDNGTITVPRVNCAAANRYQTYGEQIQGTYQYSAMADGTYRMDRGGEIITWE